MSVRVVGVVLLFTARRSRRDAAMKSDGRGTVKLIPGCG